MNETTVLLLSMRRLADLVASCTVYEFEDVIESVTGAERLEASDRRALEFSRRAYKYARRYTGSKAFAAKVAPAPHLLPLERSYDLFFPVFNHPHELYALAQVPTWRKHCRFGAAFISEAWHHLLPRYLLELLGEFDIVFVGCRNIVEDVARLTRRPCAYLPAGVDVLSFAPYPEMPARNIDVAYIGRRSPVTHAALLALERQRRSFFYYYDTVAASGVDLKQRTFHVQNASEHRLLLASILQRSRYYVANRARVNEPEFTAAGDELSFRFFEGAAAGAVMLGEPPRSDEFQRQFDWTDAIIPMPFDAPQIALLLAELDAQPTRLARISRDNIYHAALRHDWVYRLRDVFQALGLPPTKSMLAREARLRAIAAMTRTAQAQQLLKDVMSPLVELDDFHPIGRATSTFLSGTQ